MIDEVPAELLALVEAKCQTLERYEQQALSFVNAVSHGQGFGSGSAFPVDVVPKMHDGRLARACEAILDPQTLPCQKDGLRVALFELPQPCPSLLSGFCSSAFTEEELQHMPKYMTTFGTKAHSIQGRFDSDGAVYAPFLLLERTYGHAKHELESAMNLCAINGAAALNAINICYASTWSDPSARPVRTPAVFSCIVDDDLGVINHHWMSEGGFYSAPLCKFDFRDLEHFMHFLAWIEAIEEWAAACFLPDMQMALRQPYLPSSNHKQSRTAISVFDHVASASVSSKLSLPLQDMPTISPKKTARGRNTPLGVTGAMRMRSPAAMRTASASQDLPDECPYQSKTPGPGPKSAPLTINQTHSVIPPLLTPEISHSEPGISSTISATPNIIRHESSVRRNKANLGLSLDSAVRGAANPNGKGEPRSIHSANLDMTSAAMAEIPHNPASALLSSKSAVTISSTNVKSPAESAMSMQSKRSFASIRSRRIKSPATPDSNFSASPKSSTFKSKLTSGLGMIKEHSLSKSKRYGTSTPASAEEHMIPNTPAYDKKRMDIRTPRTPRSMLRQIDKTVLRPVTYRTDTSKADTFLLGQNSDVAKVGDYHTSRPLPLRQWASTSTAANTMTTTLTA